MAVENEIIEWIVKMVETLIPKSYVSEPPQKITVSKFENGQGRGILLSGDGVDIIAHPAQSLKSGDAVVGVPIGPKQYYVAGKK